MIFVTAPRSPRPRGLRLELEYLLWASVLAVHVFDCGPLMYWPKLGPTKLILTKSTLSHTQRTTVKTSDGALKYQKAIITILNKLAITKLISPHLSHKWETTIMRLLKWRTNLIVYQCYKKKCYNKKPLWILNTWSIKHQFVECNHQTSHFIVLPQVNLNAATLDLMSLRILITKSTNRTPRIY